MDSLPQNKIMFPALVPSEREGIPVYLCPVAAGWPSPAEDYIEDTLDLHKFAVRNEPSTFFLHATGNSMIGAGIHEGDILVVDRSINAVPGKVVIAAVDGELTVKRLVKKGKKLLLMPENPDYPPIDISKHEDTCIWGVVTYVLHSL
ncbi:translesion error-prone DNA polymerase V autoproteolytic subunit [Desulfovibrio sp. OttesenSCG-928-A18]|nr:translesion error-prone DNA polymerase V autoproteolytic subunit [Desulfovibrio sp. OttesenSCG-928-A18]